MVIDLKRFPTVGLCHRPTPLEPMLRLSEHLGGLKLWVKRDDCTGLATGGNKTRKLDYLMGAALAENADIVVTQGAVQSNHVRQTAAAACRLGLDSHALLERRVPDTDETYERTGNMLLNRLFGTTIEFREAGLDMNAEAIAVAAKLRQQGRRPYFIPGGGSNQTGALGYAACAEEIAVQVARQDLRVAWVVHATGSTGTQAGLLAGMQCSGANIPVMGISVRHKKDQQIKAVHELTQRTLALLGGGKLPVRKVWVDDGYIGEGYGIPATSTLEAIALAARLEGLLLDPVYSGKGMAGLIGLARSGFFQSNDDIVFLHTGGAAALSAYEDALSRQMGDDDTSRTRITAID